jgi:hypothetical protein
MFIKDVLILILNKMIMILLNQYFNSRCGHVHAEIKITVNSIPNNDYKKGVKTESRNQYTSYAFVSQNYPLYFLLESK